MKKWKSNIFGVRFLVGHEGKTPAGSLNSWLWSISMACLPEYIRDWGFRGLDWTNLIWRLAQQACFFFQKTISLPSWIGLKPVFLFLFRQTHFLYCLQPACTKFSWNREKKLFWSLVSIYIRSTFSLSQNDANYFQTTWREWNWTKTRVKMRHDGDKNARMTQIFFKPHDANETGPRREWRCAMTGTKMQEWRELFSNHMTQMKLD